MASFVDFVRFQLVILTLWISSAMGNLKVINYTQSLNHCTEDIRSGTFQQRLLVNDDHWAGAKSRAPIFVVLGDMRDVTDDPNNYGILSLCAVEFKAMLVHIEHRFFGHSVPLGSIDLAMSNHQIRSYLTINQALEDFYEIIASLRVNYSALDSPVIVVGKGYGGALATWFRLKYPYIAIGALASSTPILYYGNSYPGRGYCSIVSNDFKAYDQECYERIRHSWKIIDKIALQPNGSENLNKIFRTCRPLRSSEQAKEWFAQLFSNMAATDDPEHTIKELICRSIAGEKDPIEGLVLVLKNLVDNGTCFEDEIIEVESPFEPTSNLTTAWAWLRCTGLVYTVGCEYDTMLPSHPFDRAQFEQSCKERFNIVPHPHSPITSLRIHNTEKTLSRFGQNIIFVNGLRDPFSSGGILKNLSKTIHAIIAANGTYAWDMKSIDITDPEWLQEKREEELNLLRHWNSKGFFSATCKLLLNLLFDLLSFIFIYVP